METKTLIKLTYDIQQVLAKLHRRRYLECLERLSNLVSQFKELGTESRKLGLSLSRHWLFAAERCRSRVNQLLKDIPYTISRIRQLADEPKRDLPRPGQIAGELNQIENEFDGLDYDKENRLLSVETESITLDHVYLGPFRIQLHIDKIPELYKESPYFIAALDAHPAATDDNVTHPHVSSEKLCEGDGSITIRTSLEQGRLCDFFTMVRSILQTYNPDSPYVSLSDWEGEPCYDCGYVMDSDNICYCSYCDHSYCEQCSTCCNCCYETCCLSCCQQCSYCEETACINCMSECSECESMCCNSCLKENLCPNCKEELENEDEQQTEQVDRVDKNTDTIPTQTSEAKIKPANQEEVTAEQEARTEIQPDGVGETAVFQGQV